MHTAGIGSATGYALGSISATNVLGLAERSPAMFMDGVQTASWTHCDLTTGLLAGTVMVCSETQQAGGLLNFSDSSLATLVRTYRRCGSETPWPPPTSTARNSTRPVVSSPSPSQVPQDFSYFAGYPDNPSLAQAQTTVNVGESQLVGDLVAYNSSSIAWTLQRNSSWRRRAYSGNTEGQAARFGVHLDNTSTWALTGETQLVKFHRFAYQPPEYQERRVRQLVSQDGDSEPMA